jgi:septal ring factor EnvC (AmiA/AmiB activator)
MLLSVVPAVIPAPTAGADRPAVKEAELEQIRTRISGVKKELDAMRGKRNKLQARLEKTEKEIGRIAVELHRLDSEVSRSREQLQELASRKQSRLADLQRMHAALAHDMRTAYAMGKQEQVKLLLGQQDPAAVGRMMSYQRYFSNARTERLTGLQSLLEELATLETEAAVQQAGLEALRSRKQESAQRLEQEQDRRKAVLVTLRTGLEKKTDELATLKRDEQRLQDLIASLQQVLTDIPLAAGVYRSLQSAKGRLSWPVAGRIHTAYGARPGKGKPKSRGVFVGAPDGTEVHAIHQGRVAFADWLRGFGLLLIIDHGNGYMSLYGHNRGLFKQPGERVETGETIAIVGNSGGGQRAGLYLELRKDGQPINPAPWFAGKPSTRQAVR